jgi:hypothetical protein
MDLVFSELRCGIGKPGRDGFDEQLHGNVLREFGVIQVGIYFDNIDADEPPVFTNPTEQLSGLAETQTVSFRAFRARGNRRIKPVDIQAYIVVSKFANFINNRHDSIVMNAIHRENEIAMLQTFAVLAIRAFDASHANGDDAFDER